MDQLYIEIEERQLMAVQVYSVTDHVAAELVIEEVCGHMGWKQVEEDPPVGALQMKGSAGSCGAWPRSWPRSWPGSCGAWPPAELPCRASRPEPAAATRSPAWPSTPPASSSSNWVRISSQPSVLHLWPRLIVEKICL